MLPANHDPTRPWTLLPLPKPSDWNPNELGEDFFYNNVAKPLIRDTIRLMNNGLPIDLTKVKDLEDTVDTVLANVDSVISTNTVIQDYYKWKHPKLLEAHLAEYDSKIQSADKYIKPFNPKDIDHRSYFVHAYIEANPEHCFDIIPPPNTTVTGLPKWTLNDVKRILHAHPDLAPLTTKTVPPDNPYATAAMQLLAQHKADKFNERHDYLNRRNQNSIADIVPKFNPASSDQLHELLTGMLGYESDLLTDSYKDWQREVQRNARYGTPIESATPKNKFSWPRGEVEKIKYTVEPDSQLDLLLQAFIDHSFAAIIKQNFIEAFYTYTVDGRLYGTYKLLGALSARYTSNNP
jgi:hypothetical protein